MLDYDLCPILLLPRKNHLNGVIILFIYSFLEIMAYSIDSAFTCNISTFDNMTTCSTFKRSSPRVPPLLCHTPTWDTPSHRPNKSHSAHTKDIQQSHLIRSHKLHYYTSHSFHLLFSMHHPHIVILISVDSNISFCYFCTGTAQTI